MKKEAKKKENTLSKDKMSAIIQSLIMMVFGAAFCFSLVGELLSMIMGIAFIVSGVIFLTITIINEKAALTPFGIYAMGAISVGIFCIVANFIGQLIAFVPYLLTVVGSIIIIDAFLRYFWKLYIKTGTFVFELLVGTAALALGVCLITIPAFARFAGIVLGIILIIAGLYLFVYAMIAKDKSKK